MQLDNLEISLQTYGENKGKYTGRIRYKNPTGEINLVLSNELSQEMLKFASPLLNKYALNGMAEIQQAIVTATAVTATTDAKK